MSKIQAKVQKFFNERAYQSEFTATQIAEEIDEVIPSVHTALQSLTKKGFTKRKETTSKHHRSKIVTYYIEPKEHMG